MGHLRAVEVGTAVQDQRAAYHYPVVYVCACVHVWMGGRGCGARACVCMDVNSSL